MDRSFPVARRTCLWGMFVSCVGFVSFLMYCVPMASDDLVFSGLEEKGFSSLLHYVLSYGNGRVLGNLGAVCLVRMPGAAVLVKALVISGMLFLLPALLDMQEPWGYLLSFLLFVGIPPELFGQVYSWTSGFQNYIPPVFTTLLTLFLLKKYDTAPTAWIRGGYCFAVFLLGAAGQLYAEHAAVANLILAGCVAVKGYKNRRGLLPAALWLAGVLLGSMCMVLVPVLFSGEGSRMEAYRAVHFGDSAQMLRGAVKAFAVIGRSLPYPGILLITIFTMVTVWLTGDRREKKWNQALFYASGGLCLYMLLNELLVRNSWYGRLTTVRYFVTACVCVAAVLLWIIALIPLEDICLRNRIYRLCAAAALSVAPLLFVSPVPSRTVFQGYVWIVAGILLFARYLKRRISAPLSKQVKYCLGATAVLLAVILSAAFLNIRWMGRLREEYIHRQMDIGAREIAVFRIPYDYVYWDGLWCFGRKYYYTQWDDITFNEEAFSHWYNVYFSE